MNTTLEPPLIITTSEFSINLKEIIILSLMLLLLIYSIVTFLNRWSKNYRDINQGPYYTETDAGEQFSVGEWLMLKLKGPYSGEPKFDIF